MAAQTTVRSGLKLITTKALAIVVIERETRKAADIAAHIRPETRPGKPARLTAFQGEDRLNDR